MEPSVPRVQRAFKGTLIATGSPMYAMWTLVAAMSTPGTMGAMGRHRAEANAM
jgi:hypothetical protein